MKRLAPAASLNGLTAFVAASLVHTSLALAQDNDRAPPSADGVAEPELVPPPTLAPGPLDETTTPYTGPNGAVIAAGSLLFVAAYVPVVAVGAGSGLDVDRRLYIPVAGPWLDLAQRQVCQAGNLDCDYEIVNKMLLAAAGIVQGLGVLTALAGFLVTEHEPLVTTAKAGGPTLRVSPEVAPGEAGLVAAGAF